MRITNPTISRNYTSNLNKNLQRLNRDFNKVQTGRGYMKMAEDTATAVRAMNVRRNMSKVESYIDNTKTTQSTFSAAETNLLQISSLTQGVRELYTSVSGDKSEDELKIIATQLGKYREEILTLANGQFADRYLFGGTNTNSPPFAFNVNNKLTYNGVPVEDIEKSSGEYDYLFNDAAYVDLGLGMTMKGGIQDQDVIENSAFKNTLVGIDFLGFGPDNIVDTIQDMIDSISSGSYNVETHGKLLNSFIETAEGIGVAITNIGADSQYLDFTLSRLEDQQYNLTERQDTLEFADPYESITNWEMSDYVYNAALQMGSRLLQSTLFDFIS